MLNADITGNCFLFILQYMYSVVAQLIFFNIHHLYVLSTRKIALRMSKEVYIHSAGVFRESEYARYWDLDFFGDVKKELQISPLFLSLEGAFLPQIFHTFHMVAMLERFLHRNFCLFP